MKPSWRFALLVVGVSAVLFVAWPAISSVYRGLSAALADVFRGLAGGEPVRFDREKDSYLLIPAIAVIVAAQGFSWRRKLAFVGAAAGGLLLFGTFVTTFQLGSRPLGVLGGADLSTTPYVLFGVVFPVALVVAFVGGEPARLWTVPQQGLVRCPVCGRESTDLRHHVATAHGREALKRSDVKRALRSS